MSCITQTYASKLGLNILDASVDVKSRLTGVKFKTGLAIADSLYIGDILIRNAVFLVMPDAKLRLSPFYSIDIIIGFPIIKELKEIQVHRDGRMTVPLIPSTSDLHNMALDGPDPVLFLQVGGETLGFELDLGAVETDLYATYFERYQETVITKGRRTSVKLGGAGGSKRKDVYILPALDLTVEKATLSLHKVKIFTQKTYAGERFYGNIGLDFIRGFEGFTLNFKSMYFKVN